MLNNLRKSLGPALERMGRGFAATGLSPNSWTALGLALALAAAAAYGVGGAYPQAPPPTHLEAGASGDWWGGVVQHAPGYGLLAGGALLLASGFFDMVDGQVARVTGKASQRGAYLDSVSDKIAESALFVGIMLGGYADPWIVVAAATLSLLVGYARAKSDSLGVKMQGVGIGERAERLLVIAIVGMAGFMELALLVVIVISAVTLVQRVAATSRMLR